ncbi:MAG TPA: arylesterase, partial [Albitalea sp.]
LVVGDSLSAEYGIERGRGWVSLLERRLADERIPAMVVNASVSGDTTSGGRARLAPLLKQHRPTHVILELGGNDALRGLPLASTQANLAQMAQAAKAAGARVLIVGMQLPPNYGRRYSDEFAAMYANVARQEGAALVPFMLKGVADSPNAEAMFQPDRIHPRSEAHPTILANIWPVLATLLR